ncbi:type I-E CRISPR-associated protein Cse2/CasB [Actinomycetaceae bacterium L2_0104]
MSTGNNAESPNVGSVVAGRIERLQASFLRDSSTARAQIAQLRHAARSEPGTVPTVWDLTSYPVSDRAPDEATAEERAVHDAMCLYAISQQGNSYGAHKRGSQTVRGGFGDAVRSLAWQSGQEESRFRRRFNAAVSSDSYDELLVHVTALIRQIFSSKLAITMDFGELAKDLRTFHYPDSAGQVRRRWARQYATPPFAQEESSAQPDSSK